MLYVNAPSLGQALVVRDSTAQYLALSGHAICRAPIFSDKCFHIVAVVNVLAEFVTKKRHFGQEFERFIPDGGYRLYRSTLVPCSTSLELPWFFPSLAASGIPLRRTSCSERLPCLPSVRAWNQP